MPAEELVPVYQALHASQTYGNTSLLNARFIRPALKILKPESVIDYGCGQSLLLDNLDLPPSVDKVRYDPAIPAYSTLPKRRFDVLLNIDVLEHIREPDLDPVIEEMRSLATHAMIIVDTIPAKLILPSGENAHVTLKPIAWWREKLGRHFPVLHPFRAIRPTRAAFRTFDYTPAQQMAFAALRLGEESRHGVFNLRRLGRKIGARLGGRQA